MRNVEPYAAMIQSQICSDARYSAPCWDSFLWRNNLAHIMGVNVNETKAETTIVTLRVMANSRNSRPTMSPMNNNGINTAISDTLNDTMVKPISSDPFSAAC